MRNVVKMPKANDSEAEHASPAKMAGGSDGGPPTDLLERVMRIEVAIPTLATKSDLMELRMELRTELHQEIGKLRSEMHQEIGILRAEMYKGFAEIHQAIQMQTWRILGLFFGIMIPACGGMIAATYYIANHAVK